MTAVKPSSLRKAPETFNLTVLRLASEHDSKKFDLQYDPMLPAYSYYYNDGTNKWTVKVKADQVRIRRRIKNMTGKDTCLDSMFN